MKPYGLCADLHLHSWSAFSSVLEDGTNSRLTTLLSELTRCAAEVKSAGGDTMIVAGDIFHVRGSVAPLVLNPTMDCFKKIIASGVNVYLLAGNHDAELKDVTRLSSAITALEGIGCVVINTFDRGIVGDGGRIIMIPWTQNITELKLLIEKARDSDPKPAEVTLILHAPIDGVIVGIPDHGLEPAWLASVGFNRVFSGHYHNHSEPAPNVYSIGALAHHTYSDIGSKAGFLIVRDCSVQRFASHAPSFVEIDASTDPEEVQFIVDGNFVRAKINSSKQKEVEELRAYLNDCGAKGVTILAVKDATASSRTGATVKSGASLEVSVADFIKGQGYGEPEKLAVLCQEILSETRGKA